MARWNDTGPGRPKEKKELISSRRPCEHWLFVTLFSSTHIYRSSVALFSSAGKKFSSVVIAIYWTDPLNRINNLLVRAPSLPRDGGEGERRVSGEKGRPLKKFYYLKFPSLPSPHSIGRALEKGGEGEMDRGNTESDPEWTTLVQCIHIFHHSLGCHNDALFNCWRVIGALRAYSLNLQAHLTA